MDEWPFDDPENVAVITLRQIVFEAQPILHVTHDCEDGTWQFLGAADARIEDAAVVLLSEIVDLDPSVAGLADFPLGWHAWRCDPGDRWVRAPRSDDD